MAERNRSIGLQVSLSDRRGDLGCAVKQLCTVALFSGPVGVGREAVCTTS